MTSRTGTFLDRPRLSALLTGTPATRLTTLVAPAGYGKTALLAAWVDPARTAWHTCAAQDRETRPALRQLAEAIRNVVPALDFTMPAFAGDAIAAVAALADALRTADLTLVLDDVHVVGERDPSARLLEGLCQQLPPGVRLVLAGRRPPPFPVRRLRDAGQLVELTAGDLAFTAAETTKLSAQHGITGGWPVAVRLVAEAAPHVTEPIRLFDCLRAVTDEPAREFLRDAARFSRFRPELLAALGHPGESTAELTSRGLVEALPPASGWYRLVPFVAELVRAQLPHPDPRSLYDAAARWFTANDHLDAALSTLATLGDHDRVQRFLHEHAEELLRRGGADTVVAAVRLVPPADRDHRTWQLAGEAHQVRGDWDSALNCLQRTVRKGQCLPAAVARRIAWSHYLSGATADALDVCGRSQLDGADPASESLLHSCAASAQWARGELDACRAAATTAMTTARECGDDAALAAAHTVLAMLAAAGGDQAALTEHNRAGLRHAERAGDVLSLVRIRSNRASHLIEASDYRGALAELEVALPLAELTGFTTYRAFCLNNRGEARLGLGQLDEAAADLAAARDLFTAIGPSHAAVPLTWLAETYRLRGDRVQARTAYQRAIRLAEANDTATQLVPALAGLARLLVDDDPAASAELVGRARAFGTGFGYQAVLLASAALRLGQGDWVAALHTATEAELLARARGDHATCAEALELRARAVLLLRPGDGAALSLVDDAARIWRELGNSRAEHRVAAISGRGLAVIVGRSPTEAGRHDVAVLSIQTLGGFRVLRGGEPVPGTAWQSRKARDLVKILVTRRGRPTTREALISLLWPGEPADRVGNRLSVALSTARSVLGRGSARCVVAEGDTVRLDPALVAVDVLSFLTDAQRGLAAWRVSRPEAWPLLHAAEAAYTGDFLEEDPYEDWTIPLREEARLTYVQVATVLAGHTEETGEHITASRYCLRILERDQYNEPAHLALVRALAAAGSHGEARRRYRTYVDRMMEIDVEPRPFPSGW